MSVIKFYNLSYISDFIKTYLRDEEDIIFSDAVDGKRSFSSFFFEIHAEPANYMVNCALLGSGDSLDKYNQAFAIGAVAEKFKVPYCVFTDKNNKPTPEQMAIIMTNKKTCVFVIDIESREDLIECCKEILKEL